MSKFKHLVTICFCGIILLSCETKKKDKKASNQKPNVDTLELNVARLRNDEEKLSTLNFENAILSYGEPQEEEFKTLDKESIHLEWGIDIEKNFPNKEFETKAIKILEASWQLQDESWITVWYKMENDVWKPVDVLVTI